MSTVLIAYDGSSDARHAITETARLLPGTRAVVLYVRHPWKVSPPIWRATRPSKMVRDIDLKTVDAAANWPLKAPTMPQPRARRATAGRYVSGYRRPDVIVDVAEQADASLIVLRSRGRRGLAALLAGSTSTQVLHAARRPVLVIPSTPLAEARRQKTPDTPPATDGRTTDDPPM